MDIFKTNPICGNGYLTGQAKFLTGKAVMHGAFNYEEKGIQRIWRTAPSNSISA